MKRVCSRPGRVKQVDFIRPVYMVYGLLDGRAEIGRREGVVAGANTFQWLHFLAMMVCSFWHRAHTSYRWTRATGGKRLDLWDRRGPSQPSDAIEWLQRRRGLTL